MKVKYRVWDGKKYISDKDYDTLGIDDHGNAFYCHTDSCESPCRYIDNDCVIEFFIDIKDKFDKEIFEGDIVKYKSLMGNETIGYVKFKQGSFRISKLLNAVPDYKGEVHQWNDGYNYWYSLENIESFDIEIIGNINNNPDLL